MIVQYIMKSKRINGHTQKQNLICVPNSKYQVRATIHALIPHSISRVELISACPPKEVH